MFIIILSAYMSLFDNASFYDVVEWEADTLDQAYIQLATCQDIAESSNTILQCELYID